MDILSTVGLSKHFGGVRALDGVDFSIKKGSIHGIIGPNGSGKTTTFNVISGVLPATEGKVFFNNTEITNLNPYEIAKMGVSRTFQMPRVMPKLSCLENVMTGLHCRTKTDVLGTFLRLPFKQSSHERLIKNRVMELLDFVGLADSAQRWASELVWAEHHLLQIARAMMTDPQMLMLDEPASGMGEAEHLKMKEINTAG